jgi:pimeloyl-ACP methyl ester carboxylesterase
VSIDKKIRDAEVRLFSKYGLTPEESHVELPNAKVALRVLSTGDGPEIVFLHGVSLSAAIWMPLLDALPGYRAHLVELPGHGLSGPFPYTRAHVRQHTVTLLDDLFDAMQLERPLVVGHSLGEMFALWHAALRTERIAALVAIGDPAAALPGVKVKMPLSLMTVPGMGRVILRSPASRAQYRRILAMGLSKEAAKSAPDEMLDVLRQSVIWHRTCKRLELPQLRMHDLRHTAATLLLQADIHPKVVQEMLGHSSITITLDRYSHVIPAMHRQAANTMDDLLGGLPSPQKEPITQEITQVSKKA